MRHNCGRSASLTELAIVSILTVSVQGRIEKLSLLQPTGVLSGYQGEISHMVNTLFLPELKEMLAENNTFELHEFCTALHPARTAEFMEGLDAADAWKVLQHADLKLREEIFGYF